MALHGRSDLVEFKNAVALFITQNETLTEFCIIADATRFKQY
jgi:hypothetical protein